MRSKADKLSVCECVVYVCSVSVCVNNFNAPTRTRGPPLKVKLRPSSRFFFILIIFHKVSLESRRFVVDPTNRAAAAKKKNGLFIKSKTNYIKKIRIGTCNRAAVMRGRSMKNGHMTTTTTATIATTTTTTTTLLRLWVGSCVCQRDVAVVRGQRGREVEWERVTVGGTVTCPKSQTGKWQ